MSSSDSNDVSRYYSHYTHGVDEKRRIQVPSKWRPHKLDTEFTLMLWDSDPRGGVCLRVYPPKQMEVLLQKTEAMSTSDPSAVALRRNIAKNCEPMTMDKSGRFCIPEWMAKKAAIDRQVVLAGALQWFEIWNPERYASTSANDEALSPESVRQI